MKTLQLVLSCKRDRENGAQDACRETWLRSWGHLVDCRFLLGEGNLDPRPDELIVREPDDFNGCLYKQHQGYRWAYWSGYEHVFISSVDCYRILPRMLDTDYRDHDYTGCQVVGEFYAGGSGYWLSRNALEVLTSRPAYPDYCDRSDGITLLAAGIHLHPNTVYWGAPGQVGAPFDPRTPGVWASNIAAINLGRGTGNYDPMWMHECHEEYLKATGAACLE